MSLFKDAKEFFGLAPMDAERDDAYYDDEPRYADDGAAAYAPRYDRRTSDYSREPRPSYRASAPAPAPVSNSFVPAVVTVEPRSYSEAAQIGEPFRDGDAVIFELTTADKAVAKRIIDFAAGLCFASHGDMHKLNRGLNTDRLVFAVVPDNADITVNELQQAAGLAR
ncbi:cell division protein SepF [Corynebacterium yudongzhengii]|uniref:Cell division protein SepF n=1 Tax=Corynebacterium yudongzhengii TaxID=2080740 RepID=A0A2U1T6D4_9CORY|nr:cell division protein SepF [Corynebacterium yudongzhengii]AWB81579.1 cell division protein SepF [Corynebacterium yudongzhengii]PWC01564.1 DUF552 domain-containing protein [Corynebacterium yudongzhengii]